MHSDIDRRHYADGSNIFNKGEHIVFHGKQMMVVNLYICWKMIDRNKNGFAIFQSTFTILFCLFMGYIVCFSNFNILVIRVQYMVPVF